MKLLYTIILLLSLVGCGNSVPINTPDEFSFVQFTYSRSVAILYIQSNNGKQPACTATAFAETGAKYLFVSAGHCVVGLTDRAMWLSPDSSNPEIFYPVTIRAYGLPEFGNDYSVLEITAAPNTFTLSPLGHNPRYFGEEIFSISAPEGITKSFTRGTIAVPDLAKPAKVKTPSGIMDWQHDVIGNMYGIAEGSSGAAIICKDQMAVCAILIGLSPAGQVYLPIERFEQWWKDVSEGRVSPIPLNKIDIMKQFLQMISKP